MSELLTQEQIEARMYYGGIARAEKMMADAEASGDADRNPYAGPIFSQYVLPLSQVVKEEIEGTQSNHRHTALDLLDGLDYDVMAYVAVRTVVTNILQTSDADHRRIAYSVGKAVHSELVLAQIEAHNPELYHTLVNDFGRKLSKDARHRMTVFKRSAKKAGIEVIEWAIGNRDQVGMYLLGLMEVLGLIEIAADQGPTKEYRARGIKQPPRAVFLSREVMDQIIESKSYTAVSMPVYGPTVIPPRDWSAMDNGGFFTPELIRSHRYLMRSGATSRAAAKDVDMPVVLEAVNTLQRTAWSVNQEVYATVMAVSAAGGRGTKEIVTLDSVPKPEAPEWIKDLDKASLTEEQTTVFKKWKRSMAEWYTQRKLLGTRYGRFYSASRAADMFREYPSIYFVYFADSRGRLYPMTYGLNPQGSDLQRGLLKFSKGMALSSPTAIRWFHVQGANKWGYDKATLEERHDWVVSRQEQILAMARDPVNNDGWKQADSPIQFLAWAFEYRDWVQDKTDSFVSYLPISMDGSCNGLQNLSALLRDEIGGKATNLTANEKMEDIYRQVALAAYARLKAMPRDDAGLVDKWLTHGVNRKVVKRSVMTTPYGVTKGSAEDYIISDYLAEEDTPFTKDEWRAAARVLMEAVWPAIGDVVVKGREAMAWLKKSARVIVKSQKDDSALIQWTSPSGFPASQAYWGREEHTVKSRLHGAIRLKIDSESDEADLSKHSNGLAPNFVHSMDAAHLHRTTSTASRRGIDALAMIHDDYGTHAANAQELFEIIRSEFVSMYEEFDPITDFHTRYPAIPKPPVPGTLDIREVLQSKYFFS